MREFKIHEAKAHFSELIRRVEAGEPVVIFRGNRPVARVEPYASPLPGRRFGGAKGLVTISPDFDAPLEDFQGFQ